MSNRRAKVDMSEPEIKEISPLQAWEILERDPLAVLLDVRSSMEFEYVGHPLGAVHIPWMEAPGWNVDVEFVKKVRQMLEKRVGSAQEHESIPVLAICRSGKRSLAALEELARQGFASLYNIENGFEGDQDNKKHRNVINGWRVSGLPWEQS